MILLGAAAAIGTLQPGPVVAELFWVSSLVIAGMPHGAFDVAVVYDQARQQGWRAGVSTAVLYTVLTALAVVLFVLAPAISVVLFLVLSAHHFGVSDCVWTRGRAMRSVRDHFIGLSHGVAALAVPFIVAPDQAFDPFVKIAQAGGEVLRVNGELTRILASTMWGLAMVGQLVLWVARRKDRQVVEQAGVILGVSLLGLLAPPLLAVVVYFTVVHAFGHCWRADAQNRRAVTPGLDNALRVHWRSAPLTVPSVGIVIVIAATVFGSVGLASLTLAFLLFCVVGTLPHHLLWLSLYGPLRATGVTGATDGGAPIVCDKP